MSHSWLILIFPVWFGSCTNCLPEGFAEIATRQETAAPTAYDPAALQKMKWLSGVWEGNDAGRVMQVSALFHADSMLEITQLEGDAGTPSQQFVWKDGHCRYGSKRQWVVTWIGEKDIRFEPLVPGLQPMTWTRLNDRTWHLVRHAEKGDETVVMGRIDGIDS